MTPCPWLICVCVTIWINLDISQLDVHFFLLNKIFHIFFPTLRITSLNSFPESSSSRRLRWLRLSFPLPFLRLGFGWDSILWYFRVDWKFRNETRRARERESAKFFFPWLCFPPPAVASVMVGFSVSLCGMMWESLFNWWEVDSGGGGVLISRWQEFSVSNPSAGVPLSACTGYGER